MQASLFVALIVAALSGSTAIASASKDCQVDRLLERIEPKNYFLFMFLATDMYRYNGCVETNITILETDKNEPKDVIAIHASKEFEVTGAYYDELSKEGGRSRWIKVLNKCHDKQNQLLVITLDEELPAGTNGILGVTYDGEVRQNGKGIYKHEPTKEDDSLIRVDFDGSARQVIPCFDEPKYQTTFRIQVVMNEIYNATSSSLPMESQSNEHDSFHVTRFAITRPMPLDDVTFEIRPNGNKSRFVAQASIIDDAIKGIKSFVGKLASKIKNLFNKSD